MKNYYLYVLSILLLASCHAPESVLTLESSETALVTYAKKGDEMPFNSANAFDYAGQIHNELLLAYYAETVLPNSLDSIISLVQKKRNTHPFFVSTPLVTVDSSLIELIPFIHSDPEGALEIFLKSSGFRAGAQANLNEFIQMALTTDSISASYADLYVSITNYEAGILSDTVFSNEEKAYLLTVSSIVRHSMYQKKKRPKKNTDPDWDWLTTNIIGATAGGTNDIPSALTTALVAGILENGEKK